MIIRKITAMTDIFFIYVNYINRLRYLVELIAYKVQIVSTIIVLSIIPIF